MPNASANGLWLHGVGFVKVGIASPPIESERPTSNALFMPGVEGCIVYMPDPGQGQGLQCLDLIVKKTC